MAPPTIRTLLATGRPLMLPGVWDALSASLATRAGFEAVFLSGYCLSATRLAAPDVGLLTQTEVIEIATRIRAAVATPLIVDIDTGYGNAFNVERTVDELVRIGAAGCFLEDQVWPKRCGHMEGKRVVPLDEYLPKLRAALRARGAAPFHVTARTDARAAVGLDDAITRARAFADAGADAVFVEAPQSIAEMEQIRAAVPAHVPLVANMVEHGKTPVRTAAALAAAGYQLVAFPVSALLAASQVVERVFTTIIHDGSSAACATDLRPFGEMNSLLGLDERYARERDGR
jgi:2-methylisocitrate lyase-like PEP mutase family enzyme